MTAVDHGSAGASAPVDPPLETLTPRWSHCIVAATGPSLSSAAERCGRASVPVVAVNDAYRLLPSAAVMYACDPDWWQLHQGCPEFVGEKWSSHEPWTNDKRATARQYGVRLIRGQDVEGFSLNPSVIHYGATSGFQALNMALLWGARRLVLVGFDMHSRGGRHFFGDHPEPLSNFMRFESVVPRFRRAAAQLPSGIDIVNCTPGSALDCFPMMPLEEGLCWLSA